jgi:hypothetical protein
MATEIDLAEARDKSVARRSDLFSQRRPALYRRLVSSH